MTTTQKELQRQFKVVIEWFQDNQIDIKQLENIMLELNPHSTRVWEWAWYRNWVKENINAFKAGAAHLLSLTSSGGMYQSFED
jgi:hypothetical protein